MQCVCAHEKCEIKFFLKISCSLTIVNKNYYLCTRKTDGCSSVGRASVSKTECRAFESLLPCSHKPCGVFHEAFFVYIRMEIIARIETDFPTKFGLPRQSRLINALRGTIVFEPKYRNVDAIRGLEDFSHIWLLWQFSEVRDEQCHPTVRPPRLGGNMHMGVFATRSPFRPNRIGLSCVEILSIDTDTPRGPVIHVAGIDMMNGTPIFDIKPYIPYCDSIPDAKSGFTAQIKGTNLDVNFECQMPNDMSDSQLQTIKKILASDPRPRYHDDETRIYGFDYAEWTIRFSVLGDMVKVMSIERKEGL